MRGRPEDYDYELPRELIAQYPSPRRSDARLLVVRRSDGTIEHRHFFDIGEYLDPGDVLVINETKVIAARLVGRRLPTGGTVEVLLVVESRPGVWDALVRPGRKMAVGTRVVFGDASASAPSGKSVVAEVVERLPSGLRRLRFETTVPLLTLLDEIGAVPLPPYIRRPPEEDDRQRYQTVYARVPGAVAAPTAGLHFTETVLSGLASQGVDVAKIVLHVGPGTFRPVRCDDLAEHKIEPEYYEIGDEAAAALERTRENGKRIVAVGTTVVRALESAVRAGERGWSVRAHAGWTDLFIYPPYRFRAVDALLTNFHLPRTTLLMLVAAFAGRDLVLRAYAEAVRLRYRFYSYGDAMLVS
ncbi:S-adenosylmethionine:tRNA ribosyltransferase-isomerase [candidate division TA06 bacterium SM1_40]|uniref:S-adenosylmethionine:tRNA ribosyltransferase-isomerase n=2 Tax=Bacteria division TA06 TaxID=1156500 RepID=A0A0S8JKM9_UNCT6|nr:MAG: S-adenosylmethionine:tRNA ribosyltransferase-isomerase [candidate division TA06 bacterium SM23_40]KPL09340.1 MAG: S-adenosylmethionine:tRNA ribosyltransferase-isomerase [candidate division TA06 bacterium SM1_40]